MTDEGVPRADHRGGTAVSGPRILVVEHEANAGAGVVGRSLQAAGARLDVFGPEAGIAIPADLTGFDGLIVLGGSPGPTDDDSAPWLVDARRLVAEALDAHIPYLGICLGAQILAVVAGGVVSDAAVPEVGLTDLELTSEASEDPLLGGLGDGLRAMQWHFLEVTELPAGSVSLCRSDACRNQAFRVGNRHGACSSIWRPTPKRRGHGPSRPARWPTSPG